MEEMPFEMPLFDGLLEQLRDVVGHEITLHTSAGAKRGQLLHVGADYVRMGDAYYGVPMIHGFVDDEPHLRKRGGR